MDCKVFTEKLYEFILGELSEKENLEMQSHIDECSECRELYERELDIEQSFKAAFDEEVIQVDKNEFKTSIMERIDKNRYKREKTNKVSLISRYAKILAPIAACFIVVIVVTKGSFMMGSSNNGIVDIADESASNMAIEEETNYYNDEAEAKEQVQNDIRDQNVVSEYIENTEGQLNLDFSLEEISTDKFYSILMSKNSEQGGAIFEDSPLKSFSAALLQDENNILINDNKNNKKLILKVYFKGKFSIIKNIEWYNEESLLILSYSNENEGGDLVALINIKDHTISEVYKVHGNQEFIDDVRYLEEDSIVISKKVYNSKNKKYNNEEIILYSIERIK